jgi:TolA-binding protein
MRNLIFGVLLSVFTTFLTVGPVCAEDSKQTEKAVETISLEEFQAQHEELMTTIRQGVSDGQKAVKILEEDLEILRKVVQMIIDRQNAESEERLREMKEGREEYQQAVEKYFSSSSD